MSRLVDTDKARDTAREVVAHGQQEYFTIDFVRPTERSIGCNQRREEVAG